MDGFRLWKVLISELFVNLSAGWFGAVFVVPIFSQNGLDINLPILTVDLIMGIVSLSIAYQFRKS